MKSAFLVTADMLRQNMFHGDSKGLLLGGEKLFTSHHYTPEVVVLNRMEAHLLFCHVNSFARDSANTSGSFQTHYLD